MTLPAQAQIIVIGGGIIGCSTAYHLARDHKADVLLLEQGKITSGSTWHAAGLVGQLRSSASITKVAAGAYQAGFGDINALINIAATRPADAPVAVYMIFNTPPFTIVVKKDSPIKTPKDLEGKTIGGPGLPGRRGPVSPTAPGRVRP